MSYQATSAINQVLEAVMQLMTEAGAFATVTRGALPTHAGITCEIDPTRLSATHYDKNTVIPLGVVVNGKHADLMTLSDTLNNIFGTLTRARSYPSAAAWQIVDIEAYSLPRVIGREDNNDWLMAGALSVKFYWRG